MIQVSNMKLFSFSIYYFVLLDWCSSKSVLDEDDEMKLKEMEAKWGFDVSRVLYQFTWNKAERRAVLASQIQLVESSFQTSELGIKLVC